MRYVISMIIGGTMVATSFITGIVLGFEFCDVYRSKKEKEE